MQPNIYLKCHTDSSHRQTHVFLRVKTFEITPFFWIRCFLKLFLCKFQVYSIIIQHLYVLQNDHDHKSSFLERELEEE